MAAYLKQTLNVQWRAWTNLLWSSPGNGKLMQKQVCAFSGSCRLKNEAEAQGDVLSSPESKGDIRLRMDAALHHDDYFGVKKLVTLRDMFDARVHYGHSAGLRHDSMTPYIFGCRQGSDIIDLDQTLPLLQDALNICAHIVYRGGMVMFVCRNQQFLPWVEKAAKEVGEYAHCRPWKKGTFTDAAHVFNTLPIFPELCIFLNTHDTVFETNRAVVEANKLLIPSIAILDTNADCSSLVTYPVPGNDDSPDSLALYLRLFKTALLIAKERRKTDEG